MKVCLKVNKYRNIKTVVDGITFDSKKEAARYSDLKLLETAHHILHLETQPKFPLMVNGKKVADYIVDFKYLSPEKNDWIVEDVKSEATKTSTYRLKKKILEAQEPPVIITEI